MFIDALYLNIFSSWKYDSLIDMPQFCVLKNTLMVNAFYFVNLKQHESVMYTNLHYIYI